MLIVRIAHSQFTQGLAPELDVHMRRRHAGSAVFTENKAFKNETHDGLTR